VVDTVAHRAVVAIAVEAAMVAKMVAIVVVVAADAPVDWKMVAPVVVEIA
jgi:hypothetical protein